MPVWQVTPEAQPRVPIIYGWKGKENSTSPTFVFCAPHGILELFRTPRSCLACDPNCVPGAEISWDR